MVKSFDLYLSSFILPRAFPFSTSVSYLEIVRGPHRMSEEAFLEYNFGGGRCRVFFFLFLVVVVVVVVVSAEGVGDGVLVNGKHETLITIKLFWHSISTLFVSISTFHVHTTQQHHRLCSLGATKLLSALPPPPASCRPAHGTRAAAAKTRCREEITAFIISSSRYDIQS
jgi:hypothetical protein